MAMLMSLVLVLATHGALAAQSDQARLARGILTPERRSHALAEVENLAPSLVGPELREALMTALSKEARVRTERYHAARRGERLEPLHDAEFIAALARVVVRLRDPRAISPLAEALGIGFVVIQGLADFGEQAVPAVLDVVTSERSTHYAVDEGLITLRLVLEASAERQLSHRMLEGIRRAARLRLDAPGGLASTGVTLRRAIDLAIALDDPELTRTVAALAYDRDAVVARGVTDPDLIERTQQHARERLAGVPPLPGR